MKERDGMGSQLRPIDQFKQLIDQSARLFGDKEAFIVKENKEQSKDVSYRHITYREFRLEIDCLGSALLERGLQGKHIAVIGENRYEWCLTYLAVTCGLGVIVPVDKDLSPEEIGGLLEKAQVEAVVYSGKLSSATERVLYGTPGVLCVICMDRRDAPTDCAIPFYCLDDLLKKGKELLEEGRQTYRQLDPDPDVMGVLLFTSGTTGVAKGVMLSQKNICSDIESVVQCLDYDSLDSVLSILPIHHTYECTCDFLVMMYRGCRMAFCDGLRYISKNMLEYQPTILMLVPLILENVHEKVMKKAANTRLKKIGFRFLLNLAGFLSRIGIDVRKKMFHSVHESLGGKLRLVIAGAAAIDPKVSADLGKMGIMIRQGYGLTETSPIICVNREGSFKNNSVGPAMPGVEVKIDHPNADGEGEILARGNNVMLGYYQDQAATDAVIRDGWFHTGDQGYMDKKGFVYITGRIKNIIVNKTGKNIYPEELEGHLKSIPYILESVVWGDESVDSADAVIHATVVPNLEAIRSNPKLTEEQRKDVQGLIWNEVKKINKTLPAYKRIQALDIRNEEFEKTTTKKIKRSFLYTPQDVLHKSQDMLQNLKSKIVKEKENSDT